MKGYRLLRVALLSALCLIRAFAQNGYLLRVNYGSGYDVASRHGATITKALTGSGQGLYVMTVPPFPSTNAVVQAVAQDPQVANLEIDGRVELPEVSAPSRATSPLPALVDGYTRLQALRKVVLPQAVTGIAATAIFCLIFSWNEYAFAVLLTSGDAQTMPPFIPFIIGEGGQDWPAVAAATTLFVIPIVLFTILLRRHLLRGITFGAVRK